MDLLGSKPFVGTSTSHNEPYPNKQVVKRECVGHVQKRLGGRLRKFKKVHGNELLADNKKLGDIGILNDKWINKLQNYYCLSIRQKY